MNDFVDRIVSDLRAFAGELLDRGISSGAGHRGGLVGGILGIVENFAALLPGLLHETGADEDVCQSDLLVTSRPLRARLSRRPGDYTLQVESVTGARTIRPAKWVELRPVARPDPAPLRWLLHLLETEAVLLTATARRLSKQIEDARLTRAGTSRWAADDAAALDSLGRRVERAAALVETGRRLVLAQANTRLLPSERPPQPLPASASWRALRDVVRRLLDPSCVLADTMAGGLGGGGEAADLPTLYQRWVGLKLLAALALHGWHPTADPAGALFLGGRVRLQREGSWLDIWVEPRVGRSTGHPSGFFCARGVEAMPDYLLVTPGSGGFDAFVLDATMTTDEEVLRSKGRYMTTLVGCSTKRIAGVPVARAPVRSWAAAPISGTHCLLYAPDGTTGTVPLHPVLGHLEPLHSWVSDIDHHARAWSSPLRSEAVSPPQT